MHWRSYLGSAILLGARFHSVHAGNTKHAVRREQAEDAPPDLDGHGIGQSPGFTSMDPSVTVSEFIATTVNNNFASASSEPFTITVYRKPSAVATSHHSSNSSNQPTPIGAICGGIVGGLAFLGLIVLAIFCLVRRRNSKPKGDAASANQPAMTEQPYPVHQDPYPYRPHQQDIGSSYSNPNMISPWTQQPSLSTRATASAYEIAGPQARELEPVYEVDADSPVGK